MILKMHFAHLENILVPFSQNVGPKIINVYEGAMPVVDSNFVFTLAAYDSQKLLQLSNAQLSLTTATMTLYSSATIPQIATGIKTGTASWFAIIAGTSSSSPADRVLIGTITSDPAINHPLLLSTLDIVLGQAVTMIDFNFKMVN